MELDFENGERRFFDMRPLLSMQPWTQLASPSVFNRAEVAHGTVIWPGGIDVAPETLYEDSDLVGPV